MFARLPALCCLLMFACFPSLAASPRPATAKLAVYLKTQSTQTPRPLDSMKRELARLMLAAGYELEWHSPEAVPIETGAFLAVVELRGDCDASSIRPADRETTDLASTFVSEGRVLPFSWVNCGNVTRLLGSGLAGLPGAQADFMLGRAVARLIAHEFYHVLMQTREHTRDGISKPSLSAKDLTIEGFKFDAGALAQLQVSTAGRTPGSSAGAIDAMPAGAAEPVSGRTGANR